MAKQATDYVKHIFWEDNEGFMVLHAILKDALTVKAGFVKWWTDNDVEIAEETFQNISIEQLQYLIATNPEAEVVDLMTDGATGNVMQVVFRYEKNKPVVRVEAIPPDEFRVASNSKSVKSSHTIGHERIVSLADLSVMGYDVEELKGMLTPGTFYSDERYLRNPGLADTASINDGVLYGEWYMRIDGDGDGIAELRKIITIGDDHKVVEDYMVSDVNMAVFLVNPVPHTLIGESVTDDVRDVQRIKTNLIRGVLDSLANTINPKMVLNETLTNVEDALSDDVGGVIRTRTNPGDAVSFNVVPFVGKEALNVVDYMDQIRASRTGITEASKGLDPKALQSTALTGIDAIISGAQERIELIARVFAHTGLVPMFKGILREVVNSPNVKRTIEVNGKWVDIDHSLFDPSLRVKVNPTLGKGSDITRMMALQDVKASQLAIIERYGIKNPVVGPEEFRNTIVDLLELANIKNPNRYFKPITPEVMQAIMSAPDEPSPEQLIAKAELEKVKKDTVVALDRSSREDLKIRLDDDFRRDKLRVDSTLKASEIVADLGAAILSQPVLEDMNQPPE